jgi:hypothetical protein
MRAIIFGAVLGFALIDLLNVTGLHWLTWPAIGLLVLASTVLIFTGRDRHRKRS